MCPPSSPSMFGQVELLPPVRQRWATGQNIVGPTTDSNFGQRIRCTLIGPTLNQHLLGESTLGHCTKWRWANHWLKRVTRWPNSGPTKPKVCSLGTICSANILVWRNVIYGYHILLCCVALSLHGSLHILFRIFCYRKCNPDFNSLWDQWRFSTVTI